jgi:hypothetical protein
MTANDDIDFPQIFRLHDQAVLARAIGWRKAAI